MFKKLFLEHPESVGESYFAHMGVASGFGFQLLVAAGACFIHGLVPGLFKSTGSRAIISLHDRLVTNRCANHKNSVNNAATTSETAVG